MSAKILNNFESVGDMVGALTGLSEGLEEDEYVEGLIRQAHGRAANVFDVATAATASTGFLSHVYEFGVPGITKGKAKYPDPTAPEARLWVHELNGKGGNQDIQYSFRPALNRNPAPTTESTGVPSKYLRKLSKRKYIFWNKAFVMETGETVKIKSNRGDKGFLFIPTPGSNAPRNFVMYPSKIKGALSVRPGATTKGTFTTHWMRWWAAEGGELMENDMRKTVSADIERAEAEMTKRANAEPIKPAQSVNIKGASSSAHARMRKYVRSLIGGRG